MTLRFYYHSEYSKMKTGRYLSDDVPYSCCRHDTLRPCIHHHVQDNDRHFNYDYRSGLTLHERGCKHALMDYFTTRLNRIGGVIMTIFLLQVGPGTSESSTSRAPKEPDRTKTSRPTRDDFVLGLVPELGSPVFGTL